MKQANSQESGVALLMALGVLVIFSILGIAFATNMRMAERTARDFLYETQARYLAEAGVQYAVAVLKDDARSHFVFSGLNASAVSPGSGGLPAGANVNVNVIDTAREVNINNANQNLLGCLPGIGSGSGSLGEAIENYRNANLPNGEFPTKQSIGLVSGIETGIYNNIKNDITIDTYVDPNTYLDEATITETHKFDPRSAININTVTNSGSKPMLESMLKIVTGVGDANKSTVATALINNRPFSSWAKFNNVIDSLSISNSAKGNIKEVFNPNRRKPDANYPAEFCFHSGGTYEISSTATITKGTGASTQIVAQKEINATIKIFNLWNQTTKEQFQGDIKIEGDPNNDGTDENTYSIDYNNDTDFNDEPDYARVTWLDRCPLNMDECYNNSYYSENNAVTIPDSLKMGFWDDFKTDSESRSYSYAQWRVYIGSASGGHQLGGKYLLYDGLMSGEGDGSSQPNVCLVEPGVTTKEEAKRWTWRDHSIWVTIGDNVDIHSTMIPIGSDVPRICIKNDLGYIDSTIIHLCPQKHAVTKERYDGDPPYGSDPYNPDHYPPYFEFWKEETLIPKKVSVMPHRSDNFALSPHSGYYEVYKITSTTDTTSASIFYKGTFKTVFSGLPKYWEKKGVAGKSFEINGDNTDVSFDNINSFSSNESAYNAFGILKLYAPTTSEYNGFFAQNVRVIGTNGYYESIPFIIDEDGDGSADEKLEMGSVWGTKTIPKKLDGTTNAANPTNNKIAFQVRVDNGDWLPNATDVNPEDGVPDGDIEADNYLIKTTGGGVGLGNTGNAIQYKAIFTTQQVGGEFSETPVLEDVWITYLPKAKVLYWKEQS